MRLKPAVPVAALAVALASIGLVGCTGPTPAATCTPQATSGPISDAVASEITGDFGKQVDWAFADALAADTTQVTVATAGDASKGVVADGKTANIFYSIFNGTTGDLIESSAQYSSDPLAFDYISGSSLPGLEKALDCAASGSRLVSVVTPDDGFGTDGYSDQISGTDDMVIVIDVDSVEDTPTDAATDGSASSGYGTVERDDSLTAPAADASGDTPVVTLPGADVPAPTELAVQVLTQGDGATVTADQTVTFDYVGVNWANGVVFDSSYAKGAPITYALSSLIAGFSQSITGQKVGSTLLASIPADLAYPTSTDPNTTGALVFYIHIESAE